MGTNKDYGMGEFLATHKKKFLRAFFMSEKSTPSVCKKTMYRWMMPNFFNHSLQAELGNEVLTVDEHLGLPYDLVIAGCKISAKIMHQPVFPRPRVYGRGMTKGSPIQLKNTLRKATFDEGDFDYLLIFVATSGEQLGVYLLTSVQVADMLRASRFSNPSCDENGYDGKGQIKLYLHSKEDCVEYAETNPEWIREFEHGCSRVSAFKRDSVFQTGVHNLVRQQFDLRPETIDE